MSKDKKYIEFEGSDVGGAINNAIVALNVSRDQLTIKVVCEEKKGLFGMNGAKLAKIRVIVKK